MGLQVGLYRNDYNSCNNVFGGWTTVTLTNVEGPFDPTPNAPAAVVKKNSHGNPVIYPDMEWMHAHDMHDTVRENGHFAFGGAYAGTTDSRFGEALRAMGTHGYFAVPVHDYSFDLEAQS
jgi:hypothetical protein